eukprot:CAMPEP_0183737190 /NCGR_PEP_ID=MMETSP0737-20130205/51269_1 /TAXON_ID=385413 /ORGANISM="Thalassiosira miniscula, Strain CCMP1093" /LENGTH=139 /DNA_ID=CAMNT_0025971415 /DNA_START=6 /DNA_END=422 /DNA_ORIENTATION=+
MKLSAFHIATALAIIDFEAVSAKKNVLSNIKDRFRHKQHHQKQAQPAEAEEEEEEGLRQLQGGENGCWETPLPPAAWHPTNDLVSWSNGYCEFIVDCNTPSYNSQLECCNGAYVNQLSGECLSRLPAPPTTSPTAVGPL